MSRVYAALAARGQNPGLAYMVASCLGYALPGLMHVFWKARDMYPWDYEEEEGKKQA